MGGESIAGNVRLRPTRDDEVSTVCVWERDPENSRFVQVWPEKRHYGAIHDSTERHLVIDVDGRAVGYVILAGIHGENPVVQFRRIVVAQKGHGFGRAAVALVVKLSFGELGARELWLDFVEHNARARSLYERHGFRIDPEVELWAEIQGRSTRLVKMVLTRAAFESCKR